MKKIYVKPKMKVYNIDFQQQILAGSTLEFYNEDVTDLNEDVL